LGVHDQHWNKNRKKTEKNTTWVHCS
jgi:hypothetical protein